MLELYTASFFLGGGDGVVRRCFGMFFGGVKWMEMDCCTWMHMDSGSNDLIWTEDSVLGLGSPNPALLGGSW